MGGAASTAGASGANLSYDSYADIESTGRPGILRLRPRRLLIALIKRRDWHMSVISASSARTRQRKAGDIVNWESTHGRAAQRSA